MTFKGASDYLKLIGKYNKPNDEMGMVIYPLLSRFKLPSSDQCDDGGMKGLEKGEKDILDW